MTLFVISWCVAFYTSMAIFCGSWRAEFGEYPLRDDRFMGAYSLLVSAVPIIGQLVALVIWLIAGRHADLDWPWRMFGPRRVVFHLNVVAATPTPGAIFKVYGRDEAEPEIALICRGLKVLAWGLRMLPDPDMPTTLGWRGWVYDIRSGLLASPVQGTPWRDAELRCENWDESDVVRGVAGIHAHIVPFDWRSAGDMSANLQQAGQPSVPVWGIVERFGRYVLGTEGWRAEWVVIRKLHAPHRALAAALRAVYPEVEITHEDR